jgi:hypothetical protein
MRQGFRTTGRCSLLRSTFSQLSEKFLGEAGGKILAGDSEVDRDECIIHRFAGQFAFLKK